MIDSAAIPVKDLILIGETLSLARKLLRCNGLSETFQ